MSQNNYIVKEAIVIGAGISGIVVKLTIFIQLKKKHN